MRINVRKILKLFLKNNEKNIELTSSKNFCSKTDA
jgi:hypothetical protein